MIYIDTENLESMEQSHLRDK